MANLPISVQELLDGADEQFEALWAEMRAFFDSQPYDAVPDHNADFTENSVRLVWRKDFPAARWGRLFYLGVQQLRSSLDHLIYAIAVKESGHDPPPDEAILAFPVMTNPPDVPMWKVASLSDPVKAAIKWAQPDPNNLEGATIWHLEKFNSTDKHRILRVVGALIGPMAAGATEGMPRGEATITWRLVGLEDEAPFYTIKTERPAPNAKMWLHFAPKVSIERVGGHGKPDDFLPIDGVVRLLRTGTHRVVQRVADAAGF